MRLTVLCLLCLASLASADDYVTIRGQVKWNDTKPPVIQAINLYRPGAVVPKHLLVDEKSLGLANVIVWLRPDTQDRKDSFPADKIKPELRKFKSREHVIYSLDDEFVPRIVAARVDDTLKISNSSERTANVNYMSEAEQVNSILKQGEEFSLEKPLSVQIAPIRGADNIIDGQILNFANIPTRSVSEGLFQRALADASGWYH
jgi:hypothetical protein